MLAINFNLTSQSFAERTKIIQEIQAQCTRAEKGENIDLKPTVEKLAGLVQRLNKDGEAINTGIKITPKVRKEYDIHKRDLTGLNARVKALSAKANITPAWVKPVVYTAFTIGVMAIAAFVVYKTGILSSLTPSPINTLSPNPIPTPSSAPSGNSNTLPSCYKNLDPTSICDPDKKTTFLSQDYANCLYRNRLISPHPTSNPPSPINTPSPNPMPTNLTPTPSPINTPSPTPFSVGDLGKPGTATGQRSIDNFWKVTEAAITGSVIGGLGGFSLWIDLTDYLVVSGMKEEFITDVYKSRHNINVDWTGGVVRTWHLWKEPRFVQLRLNSIYRNIPNSVYIGEMASRVVVRFHSVPPYLDILSAVKTGAFIGAVATSLLAAGAVAIGWYDLDSDHSSKNSTLISSSAAALVGELGTLLSSRLFLKYRNRENILENILAYYALATTLGSISVAVASYYPHITGRALLQKIEGSIDKFWTFIKTSTTGGVIWTFIKTSTTGGVIGVLGGLSLWGTLIDFADIKEMANPLGAVYALAAVVGLAAIGSVAACLLTAGASAIGYDLDSDRSSQDPTPISSSAAALVGGLGTLLSSRLFLQYQRTELIGACSALATIPVAVASYYFLPHIARAATNQKSIDTNSGSLQKPLQLKV